MPIIIIIVLLFFLIPFCAGLFGLPICPTPKDECYDNSDIDSVIINCLKSGKKLQAVQIAREKYGMSIADAKSYVENLMVSSVHIPPALNRPGIQDGVMSIDGMDGHQFEYFCADLLRKNGFNNVSVTSGSGDQGVDVLASKDGIRFAIQCKNYSTPLGNTPVQEVAAGKTFYGCHIGVVLTNSTFTAGAIKLADATGVLLWDRNKLAALMKHEDGSSSSIAQTANDITPKKTYSPPVSHSEMPTSFRSVRQPSIKNEEPLSVSALKHLTLDNIDIEIDLNSANQYGIALDNFGLEIDEGDSDAMELLFDVIQKGHRSLTCDVEIVCNLYAGNRKVATETENVYKDDFRKKDSLSVYFEKKGICKTATKIEIFCKKW